MTLSPDPSPCKGEGRKPLSPMGERGWGEGEINAKP